MRQERGGDIFLLKITHIDIHQIVFSFKNNYNKIIMQDLCNVLRAAVNFILRLIVKRVLTCKTLYGFAKKIFN